jgi:hypothetical protein
MHTVQYVIFIYYFAITKTLAQTDELAAIRGSEEYAPPTTPLRRDGLARHRIPSVGRAAIPGSKKAASFPTGIPAERSGVGQTAAPVGPITR